MVATAEAERTKASGGKTRSRKSRKGMTDEHKAAIAEGREQAKIVGRYLEALELHKPKRGRKRTPESMQKQLDRIETELADASPIDRLVLLQQQKDIQAEMASKSPEVDLEALEKEFIKVGKAYAQRKGIAASTFRAMNVPSEVLKAAGI